MTQFATAARASKTEFSIVAGVGPTREPLAETPRRPGLNATARH
jgi:hypothetical protein